MKVNKLFGEPRRKNEKMEKELQDKLADYNNRLDDAWDLLRNATDKIREANRLSAANQNNMTALEVSLGWTFICFRNGSSIERGLTVKIMHSGQL